MNRNCVIAWSFMTKVCHIHQKQCPVVQLLFNAVYHVIKTVTGCTVDLLFHCLSCCCRSQEQTLRPEVTSASRDAVDSTELWLVQHGKHQEWIRNLCMALLDSRGVCNEALLMTRALCEVFPHHLDWYFYSLTVHWWMKSIPLLNIMLPPPCFTAVMVSG